jgi:hypothetical protein
MAVHVERPTKFERIFKDPDGNCIVKWDLKRSKNGPVSIEYQWTSEYLKNHPSNEKSDKKTKKKTKK